MAEDNPYDSGDQKAVEAAAKAAKQAEKDRVAFLEGAMSIPNGRKWFYDLLARTGVGRNPYSASDRGTAFSCGELNIGLPIMADLLNHCPKMYQLMMEENSNG